MKLVLVRAPEAPSPNCSARGARGARVDPAASPAYPNLPETTRALPSPDALSCERRVGRLFVESERSAS